MPENGENPEVTETGYVSTTDGPAQDTAAYYKATPAPGIRSDWREPPPSPVPTKEEPQRLSRSQLTDSRDPTKPGAVAANPAKPSTTPTEAGGFPWVWVAAAVGALSFFGVLTVVVVVYALMTGGGDTAPAEVEQEKTWEGLKVKKGLR
ncbi:MAG: hypothetical protein R3F61_31335 [Myxococcota bacterium]